MTGAIFRRGWLMQGPNDSIRIFPITAHVSPITAHAFTPLRVRLSGFLNLPLAGLYAF